LAAPSSRRISALSFPTCWPMGVSLFVRLRSYLVPASKFDLTNLVRGEDIGSNPKTLKQINQGPQPPTSEALWLVYDAILPMGLSIISLFAENQPAQLLSRYMVQ
jgi:hypothetical protein